MDAPATDGGRFSIALAGLSPEEGARFEAALGALGVVHRLDGEGGPASVDLLLARYRAAGDDPERPSGLETLRRARASWPGARRWLLAAHGDLPSLLAARSEGLLDRVLPETARPEKVRRAVEAVQGPEEVSRSLSRARGLDWMKAEELLRWTAVRLVQLRGVVVRALPQASDVPLQFVLLQSRRNQELRKDVLEKWLWPLKPEGGAPARKDRGHRVLTRLGRLSEEAEVYCAQVGRESIWLWLALLPWRGEPRITAALGVLAGASRPEPRVLLELAHRAALDEVTDFPLPALPEGEEASGVGHPVLEYDWIATPDYVGPDRRRAPTSFWSRWALVGRRRRVPSRLRAVTDSFADRFSGAVWWHLAIYLTLCGVDTALTWTHVGSGRFREANPLLRPLLLHHPWLFLLVKNGLALGAFLGAARFQWFRVGVPLMRAAIGLVLTLDLYWLWLLVR